MPEGYVCDCAGSAHYTDSSLAAPGEGSDAFDDVAAVSYLHDVGAEGVGAVAGDDDGGFGFVFRSRGSASGSSCNFTFAVGCCCNELFAVAVGEFFKISLGSFVEATTAAALFILGIMSLLLVVEEELMMLLLLLELELEISCVERWRKGVSMRCYRIHI